MVGDRAYIQQKRHPFGCLLFNSGRAGALRRYAGGISIAKVYKKREFFVSRKKSVRISTTDAARNLQNKKRIPIGYPFANSGSVLLSRAVTHQVSSALKSLTTVFGMGTGVTSLLSPPNICQTPCGVLTSLFVVSKTERRSFSTLFFCSLYMAYSIIV